MKGPDKCFQDKARKFPKPWRIPIPLSTKAQLKKKKELQVLRGNGKHSTMTKLQLPLLL